MSSVYIIMFTVGLAVQTLAVATICEEGVVRFDPGNHSLSRPHTGHVQLCSNNQWKKLCGESFHRVEANVICKHLGYLGSTEKYTNMSEPGPYAELIKQSCKGHESTITECDLNTKETNMCMNKYYWVNCVPDNCRNGSLRLVGGASYREGRVEVCVDGRWGTVCYNEELAGTVCQQLGFGSQGAIANNISIPVPKVNCTIGNAGQGYGNITSQGKCEALFVKCKSNENCSPNESITENTNVPQSLLVCTTMDSSTTITLNTSEPITTMHTTDNTGDQAGGTSNTALGVLIGLLALLEIATVIGCILYILRRKTTPPKPPRARGTSFINESYETNPPVQSEYSTVGPHYDALKRNEPPKIEPYQPAHPPPVGGVSDDEFYNAEDHTYAAMPKKDKVKKQEGGAN